MTWDKTKSSEESNYDSSYCEDHDFNKKVISKEAGPYQFKLSAIHKTNNQREEDGSFESSTAVEEASRVRINQFLANFSATNVKESLE